MAANLCITFLIVAVAICSTYAQTPIFSSTVCHGSTEYLRCTNNEKIEIISAMYGRTDTTKCGVVSSVTDCSRDVTNLVKDLCQLQTYCRVVASPQWFPDACKSVSKYLDVKYRCI